MNWAFLSHTYLIILLIVVLIGLIVNSFRLRKKNKKIEELISLQLDRIREESLDASLRNNMYVKKSEKAMHASNPYDVAYHQEVANIYADQRERISVQIEERGALSTKKYVVNVFDVIDFGSGDNNAIILNDVTVGRKQIQLIKSEKELYVKNLDMSNIVELLRGKKRYQVTETGVNVRTGDTLCMGNTYLQVTIL